VSAPAIRSLDALGTVITRESRPLVLYSGGVDGTYFLLRLAQLGCSRIVALHVDLGGDPVSEDAGRRLEALGVELHVEHRSDEFARDFVAPAIMAQAQYLGMYPICASLSRPLLARVAVEVAGRPEIGAGVVIHTATASQNSLRRFNGALRQLGYRGHYGSPYEFSAIPREEKAAALQDAGIELERASVCSMDGNLWGREVEGGGLDDPEGFEWPEPLFLWTRQPWAQGSERLTVSFQAGLPVAVDDEALELAELVARLNARVGAYGVGRYIGLEEIADGGKVQEIREMPAATLLMDAYRRLESATLDAEVIREKLHMEQLWVREAVEGRWYGPLHAGAQAFIERLARGITGTVTYELGPAQMRLACIHAEHARYIRSRDRYESRRLQP
jgi:argininosuccinate synthase